MAFLPKRYRHGITAQPRLAGIRRIPQGVLGLPEIRDKVMADCLKFSVSPGFVIMTIVAEHYRIEEQPDFRAFKKSRSKTRRSKKG